MGTDRGAERISSVGRVDSSVGARGLREGEVPQGASFGMTLVAGDGGPL